MMAGKAIRLVVFNGPSDRRDICDREEFLITVDAMGVAEIRRDGAAIVSRDTSIDTFAGRKPHCVDLTLAVEAVREA